MKASESPRHSICNAIALYIFLVLFILPQISNSQQLAFPTAKGAGAYASGGRGGQVIHVTTLDWDAPGGLKEAIQTPGARTIVFDVSGEIDATEMGDYEDLINGPSFDNLTIAGQSAPAGGITIKTSFFVFTNVDNVIIRYIRFRGNAVHPNSDAAWVLGANNVIYDHCTFSHGNDEGLDVSASVTTSSSNITIQNCFIQDSKTGALMGDINATGKFTFINNAFTNISHRFPNVTTGPNGQIDVVNNVVYNWNNRLVRATGSGNYNIINNYYKTSDEGLRRPGWYPGNAVITTRLHKLQTQATNNPLIYTTGSIVTGQRETPQINDSDMWTVFAGSHLPENSPVPSQYFTSNQFPLAGNSFTIKTANQAYIDVLSNVGANAYLNADGSFGFYQDTKDASDITMIQNDTFESYETNSFTYVPRSLIPLPTLPENTRPDNFYVNNDHIPEIWFQANVPVGQDHNDIAPSGYTWLEEYLNGVDGPSGGIIDVQNIAVTPSTAELEIAETIQLIVTFTPSNATNQNGTWSSNNTDIATVDANGLVTAVSSGNATITFTSADGNFTDTSIITVFPEALQVSAGPNQQVCLGDSVTLTATGATTYLWSTGATTASITVNPTATTTYTVTGYNASGDDSDTDDVTVTVNTPPTANAGDDIATCQGTAVTLTASGGSSYLWNTGATTQSITVNPNTTTTYSVEVFQNGCSTTDAVIVTVNPQPTINAGNDVTIFSGESVTLSASGATSYVWNNGEASQSITVSPTVTTTYSVTGFANGCQNTDSVTVFVQTDDVTANAGQDVAICQGENVTLTASGGTTYLWNTGATTASITVNPTTTTTYIVTAYSVSGNNSDTDDVIVTVNTPPTANAGDDISTCQGTAVTLTASGGSSYLWSTGATAQSITVNPNTTTTYSVEVFQNGCSSTDAVVVTVNPQPTINAGNNVTIFEGETVTLTATGGTSYVWSNGETSQSITVSPTVTTTYSVTGFANGCQNTDSVTVFIQNETVTANAGENQNICQGDSTTLTASGGDTYLWNTGATTQSINVNPNATSTYTVTVFAGNAQDSDDVTVFVSPNPNVVITNGDEVTILEGEFITLSATGANTYLWNNGATQPNIAVSPANTTTYSVTGFINNCEDQKDVQVNVLEHVSAGIDGEQSVCLNESIVLTAISNTEAEFLWSTGETTQSITVSPTEDTEYSVTVYNALDYDTAEMIVTVADCSVINPEEPQAFEFLVYPNPTSGELNIKINGLLNVADIYLYDVSGKSLYYEKINEEEQQSYIKQLNMSNYASGVYFLKLVNNTSVITKKIIVN